MTDGPRPSPHILDGAMGTELARRGFELRAPRWGARALVDAPELVTEIHADHVRSGAVGVVTASFGLSAADTAMAASSVRLARAVSPRVIGSIGPPDPSSPMETRARHLRSLGEALVEAGADVLFAETHVSVAGATMAANVLRPLGRPVWVSIVCRGGESLTGDTLSVAIDADIVLVGCSEYTTLEPALEQLARHNAALGVRPSLAKTTAGMLDPAGASQREVVDAIVRASERFDLRCVGGCCGTTPQFTAALVQALRPTSSEP